MVFNYHRIPLLPKLAWCAVVVHRSPEVHVYHGDRVETFTDFFVEGAWEGDFCAGEFDKADFFVGSGGKLLKNNSQGVLFVTPNHTLERLYSIEEANITYISNSLPFILYMADQNLDQKYLNYEMDFNSINKGIHRYTKTLPLDRKKKIELHYYCNILLNNKNELLELQKNKIEPFSDYEDYEKRLINMLRDLVRNAQSTSRKYKYGLVTTISKGYDTPALAGIDRWWINA